MAPLKSSFFKRQTHFVVTSFVPWAKYARAAVAAAAMFFITGAIAAVISIFLTKSGEQWVGDSNDKRLVKKIGQEIDAACRQKAKPKRKPA
jgi:hypothetical protein